MRTICPIGNPDSMTGSLLDDPTVKFAGQESMRAHRAWNVMRPADHLLPTQLSEDQLAVYQAMLDADELYAHAKLVALAVDFDSQHDRKPELGPVL